jgi:hypothetical protein
VKALASALADRRGSVDVVRSSWDLTKVYCAMATSGKDCEEEKPVAEKSPRPLVHLAKHSEQIGVFVVLVG